MFPLIDDAPSIRLAMNVLSPPERRRADRLLQEKDSRRFAVGRAVLRLVLAAAARMRHAGLVLQDAPGGKPFCADAGVPRFNLAHSGAHAVLALDGDDVGADLERDRPLPNLAHMADMVLSPSEKAHLSALPDALRSRTFLRYWTVKEAILKALGTGLAADARRIDLGALPARPLVGHRLVLPPETPAPGRWLHVSEVGAEAFAGEPEQNGHGLLATVAAFHDRPAIVQTVSAATVSAWLYAGRASLGQPSFS